MKIPYSSRIINSEHLFLKNLARNRVCSGEFAVVTSLVTDVTLCDFVMLANDRVRITEVAGCSDVTARLGSARLGLHRLIQKQTSQAKPSHEQRLASGLAIFSRCLITLLVHGCGTGCRDSSSEENTTFK
jgi:hypothetical protein